MIEKPKWGKTYPKRYEEHQFKRNNFEVWAKNHFPDARIEELYVQKQIPLDRITSDKETAAYIRERIKFLNLKVKRQRWRKITKAKQLYKERKEARYWREMTPEIDFTKKPSRPVLVTLWAFNDAMLFTREQIAHMFKVTPRTIYRWFREYNINDLKDCREYCIKHINRYYKRLGEKLRELEMKEIEEDRREIQLENKIDYGDVF